MKHILIGIAAMIGCISLYHHDGVAGPRQFSAPLLSAPLLKKGTIMTPVISCFDTNPTKPSSLVAHIRVNQNSDENKKLEYTLRGVGLEEPVRKEVSSAQVTVKELGEISTLTLSPAFNAKPNCPDKFYFRYRAGESGPLHQKSTNLETWHKGPSCEYVTSFSEDLATLHEEGEGQDEIIFQLCGVKESDVYSQEFRLKIIETSSYPYQFDARH